MAREIVIWCDPCMAEDVRTPGRESAIGIVIGAVKPGAWKSVAMCERHEDERLKELAHWLDEFGVPLEAATPKGAGSSGKRIVASPSGPRHEQLAITFEQTGTRHGRAPADGSRDVACPWCPLTYARDGSGFGRHLRVAHGFDGVAEAFGGPCPVCGEGPYQQIGNHCRRSHPELGFQFVTQAFEWARDNGDPHVVYAELLERKGSLDPAEEWERLRGKERSEPSASSQQRKQRAARK